MKVFDVFTAKSYHFITKEKDMVNAIKLVQSAKSAGYNTDDMSVGNCGLSDEPENWSIRVNLTVNQWCSFLEECKHKGYQLVIKDDPDKMYFTKIG